MASQWLRLGRNPNWEAEHYRNTIFFLAKAEIKKRKRAREGENETTIAHLLKRRAAGQHSDINLPIYMQRNRHTQRGSQQVSRRTVQETSSTTTTTAQVGKVVTKLINGPSHDEGGGTWWKNLVSPSYPLNLAVSSLQHILAMKSDSSRARRRNKGKGKERTVVAHYIIVKQAASFSDGTNRPDKKGSKRWIKIGLPRLSFPFIPFIHPTIPIPHFTAKLNAPSSSNSIGISTTTTTKCTAIPVNWQGRITCRWTEHWTLSTQKTLNRQLRCKAERERKKGRKEKCNPNQTLLIKQQRKREVGEGGKDCCNNNLQQTVKQTNSSKANKTEWLWQWSAQCAISQREASGQFIPAHSSSALRNRR